ncbi:MAG: hypothetical protein ACJZ2C_03150 [Nitrosopumilus sp.]
MSIYENNEKFTTSDEKIQELTEISQKYSKIISNVMLETQKNIIGQEDIIKKISNFNNFRWSRIIRKCSRIS